MKPKSKVTLEKKPPVAQTAPPTENSNNNSVVNAPTVENEPQPVIEKKLLSEDDKKKIASIMKVLKKTGLQHALGALELETGLSKVSFDEEIDQICYKFSHNEKLPLLLHK